MGELILFADVNFSGGHTHCYAGRALLEEFNDTTSSFVILSGQWVFFIDANFQNQAGGVFGPGMYSNVQDFGIPNDAISSVDTVGVIQQP